MPFHSFMSSRTCWVASSKKGNSLLTELNRKVEKLKGDIELVKQKIKVIDNSINEAE